MDVYSCTLLDIQFHIYLSYPSYINIHRNNYYNINNSITWQNGRMINLMFGAHCPKLFEMLTTELEKIQKGDEPEYVENPIVLCINLHYVYVK